MNNNVINDQTIAIVCSDTSRELNNLTEELQHSDLSTRSKTSIQENNTCQSNTNTNNDIIIDVNELEIDGQRNDVMFSDSLKKQNNSYVFSSVTRTNTSNCYGDTKYSFGENSNDKTNNIDQDLESSPYYTHLSQDLQNNLNNLTLRSGYDGYYSEGQSDISDTVDGGHYTGSTDDNADSDGISTCMLQSVDLRGK